ncbi:MAG: hypothetical protein KGO53_08975 [Alphaproteobacteria bacterium]|nr:hypothetical protein [Alphaproteobacteria bacterium]
MDQVDSLLEQLDMLDFVLAVFGAIILAMWFGRGKSWKGILLGAAMGGFVKPVIFTVLAFGGVMALTSSGDEDSQAPGQATEDVMKIMGKAP